MDIKNLFFRGCHEDVKKMHLSRYWKYNRACNETLFEEGWKKTSISGQYKTSLKLTIKRFMNVLTTFYDAWRTSHGCLLQDVFATSPKKRSSRLPFWTNTRRLWDQKLDFLRTFLRRLVAGWAVLISLNNI